MSKEEKEFKEEVGKELGYISGIFMSQGKTKAEDIIMPTEELSEAVDRIMLYLFAVQKKQIRKDILALDKVKFPLGERKWCIECARRIKNWLIKSDI